jgi:hypothetical protein
VTGASDVYETIPAVIPSLCSQLQLLCSNAIRNYYFNHIN